MKQSPARNFQPAYVKARCVHGAELNEPHKDQLARTRLSHLSSTVTLPSLVGIYNPFQEELFCYQSFCIKPLWAELWYNKPVVARASMEPNRDLHISPARSGKRGPMSQRGTSFGTNIEGLVSLGPILVPL